MKKLSICMLLCLSVAGCSTAPNITPHTWTEVSPDFRSPIRKRVVIFPLFGDLSGAVTDALATEFLAMGYSVVERTKVNAILKEMKLNPNEKIDITREKEVARATNADAMLIGSSKATISGGIYFINLRFVDVASGKIIWSSNYSNSDFETSQKSITAVSKSIQETTERPVLSNRPGGRLRHSQNHYSVIQKHKKVALLPFSGTYTYGEDDALYGALITDLIGYGVEMVERKELSSVLKDKTNDGHILCNQLTGSETQSNSCPTAAFSGEFGISAAELTEVARVTGADALLIGSFQTSANTPFIPTMVNLRLLDLETGEIIWAASYYNKLATPDNYILAADWLALTLAPVIIAENNDDYAKKFNLQIKYRKSIEESIIDRLVPAK